MKPISPIRDQIAQLMRDNGVTVSRLAREAGVHQPSVSRYLRGGKPSLADRLLVALHRMGSAIKKTEEN